MAALCVHELFQRVVKVALEQRGIAQRTLDGQQARSARGGIRVRGTSSSSVFFALFFAFTSSSSLPLRLERAGSEEGELRRHDRRLPPADPRQNGQNEGQQAVLRGESHCGLRSRGTWPLQWRRQQSPRRFVLLVLLQLPGPRRSCQGHSDADLLVTPGATVAHAASERHQLRHQHSSCRQLSFTTGNRHGCSYTVEVKRPGGGGGEW